MSPAPDYDPLCLPRRIGLSDDFRANIPLLGINGSQPIPVRHIPPTEQLDWIFDESSTATVVDIRSDRRTE